MFSFCYKTNLHLHDSPARLALENLLSLTPPHSRGKAMEQRFELLQFSLHVATHPCCFCLREGEPGGLGVGAQLRIICIPGLLVVRSLSLGAEAQLLLAWNARLLVVKNLSLGAKPSYQ